MSKLIRPPHVPHWVRYNHPDLARTATELINFANSMPSITYQHGLKLIADRLRLGVEWRDLFRSASSEGHAASRDHVVELLSAFSRSEESYGLAGHRYFDQELLPFRVSREISVPVRPLISLIINGKLEPVFVIGWTSVPLTDYQKRLFMTVLEDAVFSLTDYQKSKGYILLYPRVGPKDKAVRTSKLWQRGDFDLLSQGELQEQVEIYLAALEIAKGVVSQSEKSAYDRPRPNDPNQKSFDF